MPSQENLFHSDHVLNTEKEDQATTPRVLRERKAGNPQTRVPELTHFGRVRLIAGILRSEYLRSEYLQLEYL